MILIYQASNSIEAHMILNLLERAGLCGRVDGEYLQGGAGELQAFGVVRVMIEKENYAKAKEIIDEWDSKQSIEEQSSKPPKKSSKFGAIAVSFLTGIFSMFLYYNTPVELDGIDYDGNGTLDEKWIFINYLISKAEVDRNLDGKVDFIYEYDRKGHLLTTESDENFDGIFETETYFRNGGAIWTKSDTTGDDFKDYKVAYKFGIISKVSFLDPKTKKIIKLQHYEMNKLKSADIDTNGDGVLDTHVKYDSIEEITPSNNILESAEKTRDSIWR